MALEGAACDTGWLAVLPTLLAPCSHSHQLQLTCVQCVEQDTGTQQMVIEEAVNEALETDNLALQNMSGSKYVAVREHVLTRSLKGQPARICWHNFVRLFRRQISLSVCSLSCQKALSGNFASSTDFSSLQSHSDSLLEDVACASS